MKKKIDGRVVWYEGRHRGYDVWVFAEMFKSLLSPLSEETKQEVLKYLNS